jgi:hypothetical protein
VTSTGSLLNRLWAAAGRPSPVDKWWIGPPLSSFYLKVRFSDIESQAIRAGDSRVQEALVLNQE